MNCLVFDAEDEAIYVERLIFNFGKKLAKSEGYVTNGGIHGKKNGTSSDLNFNTERWAVPMQRKDGKWVISHPENSTAYLNNQESANLIDQQLQGLTIEPYNEEWFETIQIEER
jgi:hypothetical protein